MYTRAISTLGCGELTLDSVLALAERQGIEAVELRALNGTIELPGYFAGCYGSPAGLADWLGERKQQIVALDTSFRLDSAETERTALLEFARWAEPLGVRWLRVFDGSLTPANTAAAVAALEWWQDVRRTRGLVVELMVETHDSLLDAARIEAFARLVPAGQLHLLWDAHHTWRRGGEDPLTTWRAIRRHTVHLHVKDSITAEYPTGFRYVLPGAGEFPMARLRERLSAEHGGAISLEWERLWQPELAPLDEVLSAARKTGWW